MNLSVLTLCYLVGSITFIIGLKMLSHPQRARKGNLIAAFGMSVAILGTIFLYEDKDVNFLGNKGLIFIALLIGGIIGIISAKKIKMTAMPEMVSLFNGMGGACAMLISVVEFNYQKSISFDLGTGNVFTEPISKGEILVITLGLMIGAVSFAGSMIAWGKLNGIVKDKLFRGQRILNFVFLLLLIATAAIFVVITPGTNADYDNTVMPFTDGTYGTTGIIAIHLYFFYGILALALLYGIMFVLPIGGADMPVVISLLNSFTGVAAACGGFLYNNQVMLTGGILVGAAGTLLTILMCKAMNRSLGSVLIGSFGTKAVADTTLPSGGHYKEISISDAAMLMNYAKKVMIVPGYGLAVAQAQHACHDLEKVLITKGVEVKYAIHPVAGRMPGHMNVLLAEADVSYEKLLEMDAANEEFKMTDVVLILGANDVVNPAANDDPASTIYGMPILEVELAKNVIVNKRSMKPGYAGIENSLFYRKKTSMLFGDAKNVLQDLLTELKNI